MVGIGRNGADSVPSYGGGLPTHTMRQYPKRQSVNAHSRRVCLVPTAESEIEDTPESVDACWRPCGENNTGTPNTVEDRGNGGLALPAVHHTDVVGLPVPERCGSPVTGLHT